MNPLKEYPHLFANGKFKVKEIDRSDNNFSGLPMPIMDLDALVLSWITSASYDLDNYTLIARPIEDMTDDERNQFKEILEKVEFSGNLNDWHDSSFQSRLYLLSIGVYPFDQSHFDDGTVIDIREIDA